jgi:hypothetical protein
MTSETIICANCKTIVTKNNIRVVKGLPICLCCLEYNHINYEALANEFSYLMNELMIDLETGRKTNRHNLVALGTIART